MGSISAHWKTYSYRNLLYFTVIVPVPFNPPTFWPTTSYEYFPASMKQTEAVPPWGRGPELYFPSESSEKREGAAHTASTSFPLEK